MSRCINKVMLIGHCAADPEVKSQNANGKMVSFSVGTNDSRPDGQGGYQEFVEWSRVNCWGRTADFALSSLRKGSKVYIEGRLSQFNYNDRNNQNVNHRSYSVSCETLILLDRRSDGDNYNQDYRNGGGNQYGQGGGWGGNQGGSNGGYNQYGQAPAPTNNFGGFNAPAPNPTSNYNNGFGGYGGSNNNAQGYGNSNNQSNLGNGGNGGNGGKNDDIPF